MDDQKLRTVIEHALEKDIGQGDVTSMWVLPPNAIARGRIVAREGGILAGIAVAEKVFQRVNPLIAFSGLKEDSDRLKEGDELATVVGPAISVFTGERAALSFLARMSGVATLTKRYVDAVRGTDAVILDTHKTMPGLDEIDRWAVRLGGGGSNRAHLDDAVRIRSGHIAIAGGASAAMEQARAASTGMQIMVEVSAWEQLDEVLPLEPDRIILTGLSVQDIADAIKWVAGRVPLEVLGEIPLEQVREIAETGVDYISVGALTQRAHSVQISLEIDPPPV